MRVRPLYKDYKLELVLYSSKLKVMFHLEMSHIFQLIFTSTVHNLDYFNDSILYSFDIYKKRFVLDQSV